MINRPLAFMRREQVCKLAQQIHESKGQQEANFKLATYNHFQYHLPFSEAHTQLLASLGL